MVVALHPDAPVTDDACLEATGKTLSQWSKELSEKDFKGRREATNWLWDHTGRSPKGAWWGITIWVEHERRTGKLAKDGRIEGYGICSTKSVKGQVDAVQAALVKALDGAEILRVREGKDIKAKWSTPGIDGTTDVDILLVSKDGKVAITVNHNRIQTREESDGLRRAWTETLDTIKKACEA
jgi:hypothetical protein